MEQVPVYLFYFFAAIAIFSALGIFLTRNLMHAAFLLIGVFLSVAAIFVIAGAEFVAVSQIMIYVGGILVLLIFGIMLTNRISSKQIETGFHNVATAIILGFAGLLGLIDYINNNITSSPIETTKTGFNQTEALGVSLIADHVLSFELVAVLLLIALIGAAFIANSKKEEVKE